MVKHGKELKTRNILIVGIISIAAILVFASLSFTSVEINLKQIIENKDCKALQKWEDDHIYEDTLEISSELKTKIFKMEMECESKAFENIFGK